MKRWWIAIICWVLAPMVLQAQEDNYLEQWVEETDDVEAAGEISDLWQQLRDSPVNINDTVSYDRLFFLSPFQRQALRNYIMLYGQLLSHKELHMVPGFDSVTVLLMEQASVAEPYTVPRRWNLADGRHQLVTAIGGNVEKAAGYLDGHYAGDNLRGLMVYSFKLYNHLEVRLAADKDPAEAWGQDNYVGYHVMLSNLGCLERAIVGRYNVQFGQGLTLWTGLRPFQVLGTVPVRYGGGIRPAATFYEDGYQEGVALRFRLGRGFRVSAFGSYVDGTTLAGSHLEWRHGNLVLGVTLAGAVLDSAPVLRNYVYNQNYFRDSWMLNGGVDVMWRWNRWMVFGEASMGNNGAPAAIGGMMFTPGEHCRIALTGRYYHEQRHNLFAQGYSLGNGMGERGVTLDVESRLPWRLTLLASADIHRFTSLRYATYQPSTGEWLRMQLRRSWRGDVVATLRYAYRMKGRNIPNIDSTLYLGESTAKRQLQGEVSVPFGNWLFAARGIYAWFDTESGVEQHGWLTSVSARRSQGRMQASAAIAWFDVGGYYARIYFYESSLQYAWGMPALNGRGVRLYAVMRYAVGKHLTLSAKYALTYLPGQDGMGSGEDRTEGPCRQNWMMHVRWSF